MATDPHRHPFDDEIEHMLAAAPEFAARIRRTVAQYRRGTLDLTSQAEVVEQMRARGVPLDLDEKRSPGGSPPPSPEG